MRRRAVSSCALTGAGEQAALLVAHPRGQRAVEDLRDLLAAEDADDVIDAGHLL